MLKIDVETLTCSEFYHLKQHSLPHFETSHTQACNQYLRDSYALTVCHTAFQPSLNGYVFCCLLKNMRRFTSFAVERLRTYDEWGGWLVQREAVPAVKDNKRYMETPRQSSETM